MLKSWRLGHLFGFPVEINLSFLLLLAVVYLAFGGLVGVIGVIIAFASVLLHELGHALVARRLGVRIAGIELSFLGGAAKMENMPRSANHEIAIAAAGPAVSLMLGGLGLGLGSALGSPLIAAIGQINFFLAAFNLIPALPMDGGRILRAALSHRFGFVRATDISVTVARVVAVGFAVVGLLIPWVQLIILAPFLWMMGTRERMIAHQGGSPYGGFGGVDVYPRGRGPYDGPGSSWGFHRDADSYPSRGNYYRGPDGQPRRFTIRQVGGRMVIESLD